MPKIATRSSNIEIIQGCSQNITITISNSDPTFYGQIVQILNYNASGWQFSNFVYEGVSFTGIGYGEFTIITGQTAKLTFTVKRLNISASDQHGFYLDIGVISSGIYIITNNFYIDFRSSTLLQTIGTDFAGSFGYNRLDLQYWAGFNINNLTSFYQTYKLELFNTDIILLQNELTINPIQQVFYDLRLLVEYIYNLDPIDGILRITACDAYLDIPIVAIANAGSGGGGATEQGKIRPKKTPIVLFPKPIEIGLYNLYQNATAYTFDDGDSLLLRDIVSFENQNAQEFYKMGNDERLDLVAHKKYENKINDPDQKWWLIADANNIINPLLPEEFLDIVDDGITPNKVSPSLFIPKLDNINGKSGLV